MAGNKKNKKRIKTDKYSTIIKPNLETIEDMAENNFTDEEIAEHFEVAKSTFSRYKSENLALRKALAEGRKRCIRTIRNEYYINALGGQKNKKVKKTYNKDNELVKTEVFEETTQANLPALENILRSKGVFSDNKNTQPIKVIIAGEDELE